MSGARSAADTLGPGLATLLVAGNMVGSGVFLLPATLAAIGGVSLIGWVIASAGALVLAVVFGALGRLRPSADGVTGYVGEGLGPVFGRQAGYLYWVNCWVGNIAIAVAVTGYLGVFVPGLDAPWAGAAATVGAIWLFTGLNLIGVRRVGQFGGVTLALGLLPVLGVGVFGWLAFDPAVFAASWNVKGGPIAPTVQASLVSVFWAFLGLESAAFCAAAVRSPERNIPIATLAGVALAAVVYIAATAAIMGLVPAAELARSSAPFALVAERVAGPAAALLVAGCALAKASGTLAGFILVTGETTRGAAAEGAFPRSFARTRPDGTPAWALVAMAVLMTAVALATVSPTLGQQFGVLINVSVVLTLMVYVGCCLALLRFSGVVAGRAARLGVRAAAGVGMAFSVWVTLASGWATLSVALALLAAATVVSLVVRRGPEIKPEETKSTVTSPRT